MLKHHFETEYRLRGDSIGTENRLCGRRENEGKEKKEMLYVRDNFA